MLDVRICIYCGSKDAQTSFILLTPWAPETYSVRRDVASGDPDFHAEYVMSFKMAQIRCFYLYSLGSYDFLKLGTFFGVL